MAVSNVEQFMTDWRSSFFRERIVAQIEAARQKGLPNPNSDDQMEKFLAQNSSQHLEEFVFEKSTAREHYLELVADLLLHLRQCKHSRGAEQYLLPVMSKLLRWEPSQLKLSSTHPRRNPAFLKTP
ncbi:hypothetical protein BaRGS_00025022 [Batillaria attramentaria]|uniref:Mediator of RNA polymerase II transcription subunit 15 n=1 Tax=Batillaria attramentaria TaxID=370345 RepID=A0ABD0K9A5_9CAEN